MPPALAAAAAASGVDGLRLASRGRLLVHLGFFIIFSVASFGAADKTGESVCV